MRAKRGWRVLMLLAWMAGSGCTSLREIPRQDYVARVRDRAVTVVTRDGSEYEFDTAGVEADTLLGYRRREVEGPVDEFDTVRLPLDDVATISARRIDWYRTGLVGGLSLAAVVAAGLARHSSDGRSPEVPCDPVKDPLCNP